jgi:uncharacterized protein
MSNTEAALARLNAVFATTKPAAIALSGGVDSMTLAFVAHRAMGKDVTMFHAASAAVPASATARVKDHAQRHGWNLRIVDAGEFADDRYLANPSNRCFFCKSNLYGTLAALTDAQLFSGTNLDDLGDWRPGLKAAEAQGVRHPFVEAEMTKADVRAMAAAHRPLPVQPHRNGPTYRARRVAGRGPGRNPSARDAGAGDGSLPRAPCRGGG